MPVDVTIIGSGSAAMNCADVLGRAGFRISHAFEVEAGDRSPIILGEAPSAFSLARQAVDAGRHLLIANPGSLSPERLSLLLDSRKRAQALFVWSERRYHPGYRFVSGLMEADAIWRPRYLRQETFSQEQTTNALSRRLMLESLSLLLSLVDSQPSTINAISTHNPTRNAPDLVSMTVSFPETEAYLQVALGEAIERRETLLAAADRKAYVDELNATMPVRLVEDDRAYQRATPARWLSTPSATPDELARQQCLAFFDATLKQSLAIEEADLWQKALASLMAAEKSLANGNPVPVTETEAGPRFRLILGRSIATTPPSVA